MPTLPEIYYRSFWANLWSSLWRQALQSLLPILAVIQASGFDVDFAGYAVAYGIPLVFVVLRAVAAAQFGDAKGWPGLLARAVSAFVGVFAGLEIATWADVVGADWRASFAAGLAAAGTAVVHFALDPPKPAQFGLAA